MPRVHLPFTSCVSVFAQRGQFCEPCRRCPHTCIRVGRINSKLLKRWGLNIRVHSAAGHVNDDSLGDCTGFPFCRELVSKLVLRIGCLLGDTAVPLVPPYLPSLSNPWPGVQR